MMTFRIKYTNFSLIDDVIQNTVSRYNDFFNMKMEAYTFKSYLIEDRKTFTQLFGKRTTENWEMAFAQGTHIYIFSPESLEQETGGFHKYNEDRYTKTIQHELAHCYRWLIHKNNPYFRVNWMNEGLATYLSGEYQKYIKSGQFSHFLGFWDTWGVEGYRESGLVVKNLIDLKGKETFLKLIRSLSEYDTKEVFLQEFKKLYGFELSY